MSVVAVGGYGRGELAPQSDIDLLFLLPYKRTSYGEQVVEYMLYMLWDLGPEGRPCDPFGGRMHPSGQGRHDHPHRAARSAVAVGRSGPFVETEARFRTEVAAGTGEEFVEAKLAERNERHAKLGEARYVLEPNIKEGKGGLRDLHTLYWIAKYLYARRPSRRAGRTWL